MTRLALISACACLSLLAACKEATTGGSTSLGSVSTPAATPATNEPVKNTSLVSPSVQQTYNTFSANHRLVLNGWVGPDVVVPTGGGGTPPQAATSFSYGIPDNGNTIKPDAGVSSVLYEGSQPVGSSNEVTIDFNPRDAVYTVKANTASMAVNARFQDPAHRTAFQQTLVPTLPNYRYAQSGTGDDIPSLNSRSTTRDVNTIFVRDVGTGVGLTQYVTIAGFIIQKYKENELTRASNETSITVGVNFESDISRSVFAYGINTAHKDVPKSGTATYAGDMYAHVIISPQLQGTANDLRSIVGTSNTTVDFGSGKLTLSMAGNVVGFAGDTRAFAAQGAMDIFKPAVDTDSSRFTGAISSWSFGSYNVAGGTTVPTAASTIEGGFFGPSAAELGGGFRIIGNRTDERIDFVGAFAGKKN